MSAGTWTGIWYRRAVALLRIRYPASSSALARAVLRARQPGSLRVTTSGRRPGSGPSRGLRRPQCRSLRPSGETTPRATSINPAGIAESALHPCHGCRGRRPGAAAVDSALGATSIVEAMDTEVDHLLDEQIAYYRALAADYLDQGLDLPGGDELTGALDAFEPAGSVLELACGPGVWTGQLLRHATDVTAVDASPEMLAIAAARTGSGRVRFVRADLFDWVPDRRYDVVFFGFWLSHVPAERFDAFWSMVAGGLAEGGRVFFADDAYRIPDELVHGPASSTIRRRLGDGTPYQIVKVPYQAADLEERLRRIGWDITVTAT